MEGSVQPHSAQSNPFMNMPPQHQFTGQYDMPPVQAPALQHGTSNDYEVIEPVQHQLSTDQV